MDYYTNQLHAFYQPWRNVDIGRGTNWVGLGGLIRLSEFAKARKLYHDYLAENKEDLDKYGMFGGYMGYLHMTSSFALYPCFFCDQWEVTTRKRMIYHSRRLRDLFLSSTTGWYPYYIGEFGSEGMVKAWTGPHYLVLKQLKQVFDPNHIINPGMLGL